MHELALMESLVSTIRERVIDAKVVGVKLQIGELTCVVPDALRFCFDVCAKGTLLEGAKLSITRVPGRGRCRDCSRVQSMDGPVLSCICGSWDVEILEGRELRLQEVEVI